jgi:hypothetical protein
MYSPSRSANIWRVGRRVPENFDGRRVIARRPSIEVSYETASLKHKSKAKASNEREDHTEPGSLLSCV